MKLIDNTLVCLIEECSEIQKIATKILRFGGDTKNSDDKCNNDILVDELTDLIGVVSLMVERGLLVDTWLNLDNVEQKVDKIKYYETVSVGLGTIDTDTPADFDDEEMFDEDIFEEDEPDAIDNTHDLVFNPVTVEQVEQFVSNWNTNFTTQTITFNKTCNSNGSHFTVNTTDITYCNSLDEVINTLIKNVSTINECGIYLQLTDLLMDSGIHICSRNKRASANTLIMNTNTKRDYMVVIGNDHDDKFDIMIHDNMEDRHILIGYQPIGDTLVEHLDRCVLYFDKIEDGTYGVLEEKVDDNWSLIVWE